MCNVTDETAIEWKNLLEGRGMQYFIKFLQTFQDREELLRKMMLLLGNVDECWIAITLHGPGHRILENQKWTIAM